MNEENISVGGFRTKTKTERQSYKILKEKFDRGDLKLQDLDCEGLQFESFPRQGIELELIAFVEDTHEFYLVVKIVKNRLLGDKEFLLNLTDDLSIAEKLYEYNIELATILEENLEAMGVKQ